MEIVWSKGDEIYIVIVNAEGERVFCPFKATEDGKSVPFGTVNGFELWLTDADGNELDHKTSTRSCTFEKNKIYRSLANYRPKIQ